MATTILCPHAHEWASCVICRGGEPVEPVFPLSTKCMNPSCIEDRSIKDKLVLFVETILLREVDHRVTLLLTSLWKARKNEPEVGLVVQETKEKGEIVVRLKLEEQPHGGQQARALGAVSNGPDTTDSRAPKGST